MKISELIVKLQTLEKTNPNLNIKVSSDPEGNRLREINRVMVHAAGECDINQTIVIWPE